MPGAVPITSTYALTNATLPYILAVADHGIVEASRRDPGLKLGINVAKGQVTHRAVAEGVGIDYVSPEEVLGIDRCRWRPAPPDPTAPGLPRRAPRRARTRPRRRVTSRPGSASC